MPSVQVSSIHLNENHDPDFLTLISDVEIDEHIEFEHSLGVSQDDQFSYDLTLQNWAEFRALMNSLINARFTVRYQPNESMERFGDTDSLENAIRQQYSQSQHREPGVMAQMIFNLNDDLEASHPNPPGFS